MNEAEKMASALTGLINHWDAPVVTGNPDGWNDPTNQEIVEDIIRQIIQTAVKETEAKYEARIAALEHDLKKHTEFLEEQISINQDVITLLERYTKKLADLDEYFNVEVTT